MRGRIATALTVALLIAGIAFTAARAPQPESKAEVPIGPQSEEQLEARFLGHDHAHEHALAHAEAEAIGNEQLQLLATSGTPDQIGQWTAAKAPPGRQISAVHAILLP